jgi:gamma-glutamyltranspeptidase
LSQILEPAIKLAENGFPLTEIAAHSVSNLHPTWSSSLQKAVASSRKTTAQCFAQLCRDAQEGPLCKRRRESPSSW